MPTYDFRAALATLRHEEGHSDSSVSLRTGNSNPKLITHFKHLRGEFGRNQQADIFQPSEKRAKIDIPVFAVSSTHTG